MILRAVPVTESLPELERVNALAKEAFPPEEYLAPDKLMEMSQQEGFDFLALYDGKRFIGFMAVKTHRTLTYLFFLAVDPAWRSHGYGSRAIDTLKALYPGSQQVVDLEMLDEAAANRQQRERRRLFYLNNGYQPTGRFLSYLGVDYEILCMDKAFDFSLFQEMMSLMRIEGFHPQYFERIER